MERFLDTYKGLVGILFVYGCICLVMLWQHPNFLYFMLPWNVLLAILPLFFIGKAEVAMEQRRKFWLIFWLGAWLFFFPNSVYMVTDFIHISGDTFLWAQEVERYSTDSRVIYSHELMVWAKLLIIGFGFFSSIIIGLESLYTFERMMRKRFAASVCYGMMFVVVCLTGIGVYIGRFLRFNSWDILFDPLDLLRQVVALDGFAIQFSVIFAVFVFGCYMLYRMIRSWSK